MATPPATSTALGRRTCQLFMAGTATRTQLDSAYNRGWISQADYDACLDGTYGQAVTQSETSV